MSHVAECAVEKGKPMIRDLRALKAAAEKLGLEFVMPAGARIDVKYELDGQVKTRIVDKDGKPVKKNMHYRSWKDDHGRLVGDYKQSGRTEAELGDNAVAILRLKNAPAGSKAYEIGVVDDQANEGCWNISYDFYSGGFGLEAAVGTALLGADGKASVLSPKLLMHYGMEQDRLTAQENGDEIRFQQEADGSWTSEIETAARIGA